MLYTWVKFSLLAHESHDLSQAETKISVATSWANYFFSQKMIRLEKKIIILSENFCEFAQLLTSYFCLSLRYITWFMSQQPKLTNTDVEQNSKKGQFPNEILNYGSLCLSGGWLAIFVTAWSFALFSIFLVFVWIRSRTCTTIRPKKKRNNSKMQLNFCSKEQMHRGNSLYTYKWTFMVAREL